MSGTFACPHCQATYPRKPVLVGRTVRCTTCKNAFRLREDGIADAVEMSAPAFPNEAANPAPTPDATSAPPAPTVTAEPPPRMIPAPAPADDLNLTPSGGHAAITPVPTPQPSNNPGGRSIRLTAQQLQARRAMSATLTTSISAALESDAVKKEAATERRTQRVANPGKPATKEGSVGNLGPAILTGSGDEESRTNRSWLLGCLGVILVLVLAGWLLLRHSPERQAIEDFTLVQPARLKECGDRMSAVQANAWFIALPPTGLGVTPLQDFGTLRLGKARAFNLPALRTVATELIKGLEAQPDGGGWASPDPAPVKPGAEAAKPVTRRTVTAKDFTAALTKLGFDAEDQEIVHILLLGRTHRDGSNEIATRLMAGNLPEVMEILPFTGSNGMVLLRGQNRPLRSAYRGSLMRFSGAGWPRDWRVLTLSTASE